MGYPTSPEVGWYYVVDVAGEVEGVQYEVGDWIVWNGASWDRVAGVRITNLSQILTRIHADLQGIGINDHHSRDHGSEAHTGAMSYLLYKGVWDASGV